MDDVSVVQKLFKIVDDSELCNVYEEFLVNRFAWENFGFWFEVEVFKKEVDPAELKRQADLIYSKFLEEGSIFELGDLAPAVRKIIKKRMQNPTPAMFDSLQRKVMNSLALATVADFMEDDMYHVFKASLSADASSPKSKRTKKVVEVLKKPKSNVHDELRSQSDLINKNTIAKGFLFNFDGKQ